MITKEPPKVGWRVCIRHNRAMVGTVKEISNTTRVFIEDGQEAKWHDVIVDWDVPNLEYRGWISCCLLECVNKQTPKDIIIALQEMVKRRKKAYGSSFQGNQAFLADEVLQEVISILKG